LHPFNKPLTDTVQRLDSRTEHEPKCLPHSPAPSTRRAQVIRKAKHRYKCQSTLSAIPIRYLRLEDAYATRCLLIQADERFCHARVNRQQLALQLSVYLAFHAIEIGVRKAHASSIL